MAKAKKKQKLAYDPESRAFKDAIHNALTEAQGLPTKSKKPKSQMRDFKSMDDVDRQAKGGILKMRNGGKIDGCATRGKTKGRYV